MIKVFDKFETDFSGNGLAVLNDAKDVKIHREINGEWDLSFTYPRGEKWEHISADNILLTDDGQCFRIKRAENESVTAVPVYRDAAGKHLPSTSDKIGVTPRTVMSSLFAGTAIHIMTENEVAALGMEWVTDYTDYFAQSRITPIGGLISLMETLDRYKIHNELYFDNYNIALVRQIGKDSGRRIDLKLNSNEITPVIDTTEIITRLYPYGKNGLEITSVNGGAAYIDSPNKDKFVAHEGFINFDEIDSPEKLMSAAKALFDENNTDRIDIPKYSVSANCFQEGDEISLGDIVTVNDMQYGVVSKQRVVAVDYYPYEPNRTKITVGTPTMSLQDVIDRAEYSYVTTKLNTNERGEVKTGWLEMMQKNESISINEALENKEIALYKTGSLYEAEDNSGAVAIIEGRLAIANTKNSDGSWEWTTIMDAGEVLVNKVFTGTLYTSLVHILSDDGTLEIKNNKIEMCDNSGTLRFESGYSAEEEKYMFSLYDENGKRTAYLDDEGALTLCGIFKTGEDGEDRVIIDGNGIQSYDSRNRRDGFFANSLGNRQSMAIYYQGEELFSVVRNAGSLELRLSKETFLSKNLSTGEIQMRGNWASNQQKHNHGIADGRLLALADGGYVEWTASAPF